MRYTLLLLLSLLSVAVLAQDKIVTHHDEVINGFVVEISETSVFYSKDSTQENLKRIAKEDILMILKADGTVINLAEAVPATPVAKVTEQPDRFPIVDLSQYHGYLLQKGNCVYIPTDSKIDYERAGQEEYKNLMDKQGYWKVVDKPEQAHFVAMFIVETKGSDVALVFFRTRTEYEKQPYIQILSLFTSNVASDIYALGAATGESINESITAASNIVALYSSTYSHMFDSIESYRKYMLWGKKSSKVQMLNESWILP